MRNSAALKAVAIILASVALLAAVGGGIGIIAMAGAMFVLYMVTGKKEMRETK